MIDETYSATDSQLLAYVDGALSPSEREALEARLAGDPALKARLAELASGNRPFAGAYDVLLRNAPRERLAASLERARSRFEAGLNEQRRFAARRWLQPLAAAMVVFLVGGAFGLGFAHLSPNSQIAGDDSATKP